MGFKLFLIFAMLALAVVAESANESWLFATTSCPAGGDCIAETEFDDAEALMDSEINRRQMAGRRYISYGAMRRNNVPCSRRGRSYYHCRRGRRANPYRRGCSAITRCHRFI